MHMQTSLLTRILVFVFLATGIGISSATADEDHLLARKLLASGEILPLETIAASALKAKAGELLESELEHEQGRYLYEVEILDAAGQVWELKLDAKTARLLQMERED